MTRKILALTFLVVFLLTNINALGIALTENTSQNNIKTNQIIPNQGKISSEADTIDSFTVSPQQRWNITNSDSQSSSITDSNLYVAHSNNRSITSTYSANRALSKTDSKINYRYSVDNSGNTSEYFRDQLGTPMNFDSSTEGWLASGTGAVNLTETNGMLKLGVPDWFRYASYAFPNSISKNVYDNISFDLKCSGNFNAIVYLTYSSPYSTSTGYFKAFTCTTTLTHYSFLVNSFSLDYNYNTAHESEIFNKIFIGSGSSASYYIYIDNVKLYGSNDYATYDSSIHAPWGFDSSSEYFYNSLGNISNFEDGTTENITGSYFGPNNTVSIDLSAINSHSYTTSTSIIDGLGTPFYRWSKTGTYTLAFTAYCNTISGCSSDLFLDVSTDGGTTWTNLIETFPWAGYYSFSYSDTVNRITDIGKDLQYRLRIVVGGSDLSVDISSYSATQAQYSDYYPTTSANLYNNNSQYLEFTGSASYLALTKNSLSINSSTYKYFLTELYSNVTLNNITLVDASNNVLCQDLTSHSANTWFLVSCLASASYWTGTQSSYTVIFNTSTVTTLYLLINNFFWYDSSKGNTENFVPTNAYNYVDPQGYLVTHVNQTSSTPFLAITSLNIDTSIYRYLTIRIKADKAGEAFNIRNGATTGYTIVSSQYLSSSDAFQLFTIDLATSSSYWTGIVTQLTINFNLALVTNNSVFTIDYILLTASPQKSQPFQLGFINPLSYQSVLNVTQIFYNATTFYWEVNLYDTYGNIAAQYISANETYQANVYYRGTITYKILQSYISVEIDTDGGSRMFKALYPDDFTVSNKQNTLFSLTTFPDIYFSDTIPGMTYSDFYLDFINAPFSENSWQYYSTPFYSGASIPSNWIGSPLQNIINFPNPSSILYSNQYKLDIPLLDSITGTLTNINDNITASSNIIAYNIFQLDMVYAMNGSLVSLFTIYQRTDTQTNYNEITITNDITGQMYDYTLYFSSTKDSSTGFNVKTLNARTIVQLDTAASLDTNSTTSTAPKSNSLSFNLTKLFGSYISNEFVTVYGSTVVDLSGGSSTGSIILKLDNFDFKTRDILGILTPIFSGGGGILGQLIGVLSSVLSQAFIVIGRFLAQILIGVGTAIVTGLTPVLQNVASTINSVLSPLLSAISTAVTTIGTNIVSAVSNIASQVASALVGYFNDIVSAVNSIVNSLLSTLDTGFNTYIVPFLNDVAGFLWTSLNWVNTNIIQPAINFILSVFGTLWDTAVFYTQQVATVLFDWLLGIFNLLNIYNQLAGIFNFLVAVVLLVYIFMSIAVWIGPFWAANEPGDLPGNFWNIWSFDTTFGLSMLGFRIPLPLIIIWLSWTLYLGLFTVIFPANPFV